MSDDVQQLRYWWQRLGGTLVTYRRRAPQGFDVHSLTPTPPKTAAVVAERYRAGHFAEMQE